jgi:hypothetical protein
METDRVRNNRMPLAVLLLVLVTALPRATEQPRTYVGRPVVEVLQQLQAAGLNLLFSSDLVPAKLLVKSEPTSREPRQIARQVLEPHGLTLQDGPRGALLVVPRPRTASLESSPRLPAKPEPPSGQSTVDPPAPSQPEPVRIEERVDVTERLVQPGAGTTTYTLPPRAIRETAGGFENPFQVFQLLPGVAAINDEDGKLAVRGSGPEHNIVVLDGVQIHKPYRFSELTSAFLNPATAASVSLDASGLDAQHGGRLSSVTVIETRDGTPSRKFAVSGSMGLANGDLLLEGRLPKTASGSWWVTTRGTYYRPVVGFFRSGVLPSFGDVQFKISARPGTHTRLSVFGLGGRETMHGKGMNPNDEFIGASYAGSNQLGVMNLAWTPSARLASTTTVSMYAHSARDRDDFIPQNAFERATRVQDFAARQRMVIAIAPRHVLEAGTDIHRMRSSWRMAGNDAPIFLRGVGPSTWGEQIEYPASGAIESHLSRTQAGFWIQDRIPIGSRLTVEPGVRIDWNSFTDESILQPRIRVAARVGKTALWVGYAMQTQTPSHESLQGFDYFHLSDEEGANLRNERSRQIVAGFEQPLGAGLDLRVEAYRRRFDRLLIQRLETDAERADRLAGYALPVGIPPDDVVLEYRPTIYPESTGRGTAQGIEVLVQRTGGRASGWLGYTFSKTTREMYGFTFPFDFDRPQALSLVGSVQLTRRFRASTSAMMSSGFAVTPLHNEVVFTHLQFIDGTVDPIARAFPRQDGSLFLGPNAAMRRLSLRNSDRLRGYSRVDARLTFSTLNHWEVYGEVINLFGNRNYLQTFKVPAFDGSSSEHVNTLNVYENFERIPSFGVRFKF